MQNMRYTAAVRYNGLFTRRRPKMLQGNKTSSEYSLSTSFA